MNLKDEQLEEIAAAMKAHDEAMWEADKKETKKKQKLLKQISRYLPACWFDQIVDYIDDCGWVWGFEIVRNTEGHEKQNDGLRFKVFVNQTCNGGYTGDDFAGTVCLPIKNGNYLKFHYSM